MSSSLLIQYFFSGITLGGIYAMVGIGFVLVYRMSKILNLAQGHIYVLGAFLGMTLIDSWGIPRVIGIILVIIIVSSVVLLFQHFTLHPIRNKDMLSKLLLTLGWVFVIEGALEWIYGPQPRALSSFPGPSTLTIQDAVISFQSIWIIVTVIICSTLLYFFLKKTTLGKALEACSENEVGAKLIGVNLERMLKYAFIGSAVIGVIAGIVAAPLTYVTYGVGISLTIKGLTAAILGGINNIYGALVGGLVFGLLEAFSAGLISTLFNEVITIVALLVILIVRPQGILGRK